MAKALSECRVSATTSQPVIHICVTCSRTEKSEPRDLRLGRELYNAVSALAAAQNVDCDVRPVECLAQCENGCTVAFSSEGNWSYIFGDLDPGIPGTPAAVLACVDIQARDPDGLIRLRERPSQIRRGLLARIPPFALEPQQNG
jgi:predicted metal-binding protein